MVWYGTILSLILSWLKCLLASDGLRFATDMGFKNLVVEGDSRSTIVRITEMGRDRSDMAVLVVKADCPIPVAPD